MAAQTRGAVGSLEGARPWHTLHGAVRGAGPARPPGVSIRPWSLSHCPTWTEHLSELLEMGVWPRCVAHVPGGRAAVNTEVRSAWIPVCPVQRRGDGVRCVTAGLALLCPRSPREHGPARAPGETDGRGVIWVGGTGDRCGLCLRGSREMSAQSSLASGGRRAGPATMCAGDRPGQLARAARCGLQG